MSDEPRGDEPGRDERMRDERMRDAYARAVEARRAEPGRAGCASADALIALVRREGPEEARLRTLDHVMTCPECRPELELLRAIERAGGEGRQEAVERLRWRRYASVALAASAVLAVSLGPGRHLLERERGPDVMRGGGAAAEATLLAPAAEAEVPAATPLTFVWRPVPGARRYTVEVLTVDGTVAFGGETADTSLTVAAPHALGAGEYRWWVRAQGADGAAARSVARPLHLRAP